jgi:hypothetical protein
MVTSGIAFEVSRIVLVAAEDAGEPVLERLDPPRRAAVVMALLALTLVGLFLVILTMVGGHWVRRLARHRPARGLYSLDAGVPDDSQLRQALESVLPEVKTDDTVQFTRAPSDTKVGD